MAKVKFILQSKSRSAAIYARMSISNSNAIKRRTGYVIDSSLWNAELGFPLKKQDDELKKISAGLKALEGHLLQTYNDDYSKGKKIDGEWLQNTINKYYNRVDTNDLDYLIPYGRHFLENLPYKSTTSKNKSVNKRTAEKYKTIVEKLSAFQTHKRKKFLLLEVDVRFRDEFLKYLTEVEKISYNTAGRYISVVKTIVLDARRNGHAVSLQVGDIKAFSVDPPKVFLTFDEIKNIRDNEFESERLETVRDWLVISCFTGQRVGDLMRMNTSMIHNIEGYDFIVLTQEKTGAIVQIPVHGEVKKILDKRNRQFPPIFATDRDTNSALYNRYLKDVCKAANIDKITTGNISDPDSGVYGTGEYPKWMLVTSHIGRRSFATNFYAHRKYPTALLMHVTGHTTEKMFLSYIGKKPIDFGLQLAKLWSEDYEI